MRLAPFDRLILLGSCCRYRALSAARQSQNQDRWGFRQALDEVDGSYERLVSEDFERPIDREGNASLALIVAVGEVAFGGG